MRIILSIFILLFSIRFRQYFILLIPFLQYAGFMFMTKDMAPEINFIICYAELILLLIFTLQYKLTDKISIYLFILPLLSLPSLVMAEGNFYRSVFITLLLILSAYLYEFYLDKMTFFLKKNIFTLIPIVWTVFAILTMIHQEYKYGSELASNMPVGSFGILSRGGGMGGSNHAAGIILLFMPFLKDYRVIAFCSLFLILTFSRGAYLTLLLFLIIWLAQSVSFTKIKKNVAKTALLFIISLFLLWIYTPETYKTIIFDYITQRIFGGELSLEGLASSYATTSTRTEPYEHAFIIFKETFFQGIGLGGFLWGQGLIGVKQEFSNAHNLYLTLLCEGGVLFLLGFLVLMTYMFVLAWQYSRDAFFSLGIFCFYGLFSGQVYEASGLASACDYYYLIFIFAYVRHKEILKYNQLPLTRKRQFVRLFNKKVADVRPAKIY